MIGHIEPFDNKNKPIVDIDNKIVPLVYFNRLFLNSNASTTYNLENHETMIVVVKGKVNIEVDDVKFSEVGKRDSLWTGKPEGVYAGKDSHVKITSISNNDSEIYIAGGKIDEKYSPFYVDQKEVQKVQYGSDETKTHRKIYHLLGKNGEGRSGRLLVSELFTVGKGGWSGFPPHKHDTDRLPLETKFDEVYQFRFNPKNGFGAQFLNPNEKSFGPVHHIKDGSTILIDKGYHPCVAAPGFQMYYFTIIVGKTQRSLIQYFHPDYEYQLDTIPGIKDMIKNFK